MAEVSFLEKSKQQSAAIEARVKADMAKMAGNEQPAAKKPVADPNRFTEAQYAIRTWLYTLSSGQTIDELKGEGFFKNLASKINLGDEIKVRSADLTYHALLTVIASDHIAARVELGTLWEAKLAAAERRDFDADLYRIEDTGDVLKRLAVFRKADGKLMRDGFKSKQDAAHYIATELVARAA